MTKTLNLKIKSNYNQEYQERYPLIQKEIIENIDDLQEEGTVINLVTTNNKFIGKGYYGRQNKGYGWILSYTKNENIDTAFFTKKIKEAMEYRKNFYEKAKQNITTAFRVVNGEGDGLGGLTIDYFDGYYMIDFFLLITILWILHIDSAGIYWHQDLQLRCLCN